MSNTKHKVDPGVLAELWARIQPALAHPVKAFATMGIRADKGETKAETTFKVWMDLVKSSFTEGVAIGYDMGMMVAGAPEPKVPDTSHSREAARRAMHPKVAAAIDEIDAAVFNGDTFADVDARAELTAMIAAWQKRLADTGADAVLAASKDGE